MGTNASHTSIVPAGLLAVCLVLFGCRDSELRQAGKDALRVGDYGRAAKSWSQVLDGNPADAEARYGYAMSLFKAARQLDRDHRNSNEAWDSCAHEFHILLRLDSSASVRSMASTSLFQVARQRIVDDRFEDARDILGDAIKLDSTDWFAWNLHGLVEEGLGKPEAAKNIYEWIIAHNPDFIAAYINLGNLDWSEHRYGESWDDWSLGLERDSTNTYLKDWVQRAGNKLKEEALQD